MSLVNDQSMIENCLIGGGWYYSATSMLLVVCGNIFALLLICIHNLYTYAVI